MNQMTSNARSESGKWIERKSILMLYREAKAERKSSRIKMGIWIASFSLIIFGVFVGISGGTSSFASGSFLAVMVALHGLWVAHAWLHTEKALLCLNSAMLMLDFYAAKDLFGDRVIPFLLSLT